MSSDSPSPDSPQPPELTREASLPPSSEAWIWIIALLALLVVSAGVIAVLGADDY